MTYNEIIKNKILDPLALDALLIRWRVFGKKTIFTNGCFDLLHPGHVDYLAKAKSLGGNLLVGINTDASVKTLEKGKARPIQHQDARAFVLASLQMVDGVILFDESTPRELIGRIRPDILVKGADYDKDETNPGSPGEVVTIPLLEGFSTSAIEKRILSGGEK
jgi:D-glycero-beta-D-manno-heptose 1-phosphate adenylyltransferase